MVTVKVIYSHVGSLYSVSGTITALRIVGSSSIEIMAVTGYFVLDVTYDTGTLLTSEIDLKNLESRLTALLFKNLKKKKRLVATFEVLLSEINQKSLL